MWDALKETDLRPLREQAERGVDIAVVGAPGSGRHALVEQMRKDPNRPGQETDTLVQVLELEQWDQAQAVDLIILMMSSRKPDSSREQALVQQAHAAGRRVLVFIHQMDTSTLPAPASPPELPASTGAPGSGAGPSAGTAPAANPVQQPQIKNSRRRGVVWGSVADTRFLLDQFANAVIELIPDLLLGLARSLPLFRVPVARHLINETSFTNGTYAFTTGLAQIIAIVDVPVVVADTIILTKNQLFLAYKVGLALGFSTQWRDYVVEFGGVLGSGYLFRTMARTLIGLVPVIGIVPKTAIAYSGTYVVGNTILQWYLNDRHITREQIHEFYTQALEQGRKLGSLLMRRKRSEMQAPQLEQGKAPRKRMRLPFRRRGDDRPALLETVEEPIACPHCGRQNSSEAQFCQFCGKPVR